MHKILTETRRYIDTIKDFENACAKAMKNPTVWVKYIHQVCPVGFRRTHQRMITYFDGNGHEHCSKCYLLLRLFGRFEITSFITGAPTPDSFYTFILFVLLRSSSNDLAPLYDCLMMIRKIATPSIIMNKQANCTLPNLRTGNIKKCL